MTLSNEMAAGAVAAMDAPAAELGSRVVADRHGRRDFVMRRLLVGADLAGITLALIVTAGIDTLPGANIDLVLWGFVTFPMWVVLFKVYGLYDRDLKRVSHSTVDDIPWLFHGIVIGTLLTWLLFKGLPPGRLPFVAILAFGLTGLAAILSLRSFVRHCSVRLLGPERVVLVGNERMAHVLVRKMRAHPEYGLEPVGVVSQGEGATPGDLPVLDGSGDLVEIARQHGADRLVVSHSGLTESQVVDIVRRCKGPSIKVSLLPQVFDALGPSVEIDDVEGVTLLGINPPVLGRSSRAIKRGLDLIGAVVLTLVLLPLVLAIAAAIKLDSRGPVFFRQNRVGKGGNRFDVLKFRTMYRDAERMQAELEPLNEMGGTLFKIRDDPRVTAVGRFLRRWSLDELPQLFNVLRAEMSLVGPRPLPERDFRKMEDWHKKRYLVLPGITGLWQVSGRSELEFDELVRLDFLYLERWSVFLDLSILVKTVPAVLARRGAF
jgi:exopolysaccharide biosynthesis polyprenyl glycosylphosphotransferase